MNSTIRMVFLLPSLLVLAATIASCSDKTPGAGIPTGQSTARSDDAPTTHPDTSAPTSGSNSGSMDSLDPCTLLTDDEVSQFRANAGKRDDTTQARACQWLIPGGGGVFSIALRGKQGLKDIVVGQGKLSNQRVGGRDGKLLKEDFGAGSCMVSVGIGESSRADAHSTVNNDTVKACDYATRVATLIEPRLPKGE